VIVSSYVAIDLKKYLDKKPFLAYLGTFLTYVAWGLTYVAFLGLTDIIGHDEMKSIGHGRFKIL